MIRAFISFLVLLVISVPCTPADLPAVKPSPIVYRLFDQYGAIRWEDEQARLDNFAIQLMNDLQLIGYIFVYDGNNQCEGEAQARAIRAKRYMVDHRGVPWNRVIWRIEGHIEELLTTLQPAPRSIPVSYPFFEVIMRSPKSHVTQNCRERLAKIRRSKWGGRS